MSDQEEKEGNGHLVDLMDIYNVAVWLAGAAGSGFVWDRLKEFTRIHGRKGKRELEEKVYEILEKEGLLKEKRAHVKRALEEPEDS